MLKAEQVVDELKIVWDLGDGIARDPAEFAELSQLSPGFSPRKASYYFKGEERPSLLEWKALVNSLKPLLEQHVEVAFFCTSQKIKAWLCTMGFGLLGEVVCDPTLAQ